MKILEARDGFIKFEADSSVYLSSFVQIGGTVKTYIAQVIRLKSAGANPIAYAKILFLYDGSLQPYDKTLPSEDAEIKEFTFNILNNSINAKTPVIAGETLGKDISIIIDAKAFDKKMLVSVDDKNNNNILIRNLVKQFNNISENVIIIDTLGVVNAKKYTAGTDFKLPLDTASLAFMYQDCLNDATADSKSLIIEIFKDLSDYSKTVPFVPFGALKTIVDNMVDKSHVFKLLVLKNKLAKFEKLGYFAKDKTEVDKIESVLNSKCAVIDLSKLDSVFQNRYLEFLYEKLQKKNNTQVLMELSNIINKKNLKNIMSAKNVSTTFITHSRFKYLNDIKNLFDNFIITPSLTNNEVFKVYGTFLKSMPENTFLITGEAVNYIPLVSKFKLISDLIPFQQNQNKAEDETSVLTEKAPEESDIGIIQEISEENVISEENSADEKVTTDEPAPEDSLLEQDENISNDEIDSGNIQETIEENKISNEEILTGIEEKSEALVQSAASDLTPPPVDMFGDDEEENPEEEINTENKEAAFIEPVSPEDNILNELAPENDFQDDNEDELPLGEPEEGSSQEVLNEEEGEEETAELSEADLSEPESELTLSDLEQPSGDLQTIGLSTADFMDNDTELLPVEDEEQEISNEEPDELTLNEEFNQQEQISNPELTANYEQIEIPADETENEEIEVPEDFDIDIESGVENDIDIAENIEEDDSSIDVIPLEDNNSDFDEIVELDPDEADDNDIVIDMTDEEGEEEPENLDEQIVNDVDKVFTTRKDDDISDSDLDFIDQLNSDEDDSILAENTDVLEELSEEDNDGILEETEPQQELKDNENDEILETKSASTPIVPVYDADIPQEDLVMSDPIEQGDMVVHAKYGSGVVEKMIKYGNKTLYSINFDNIGRRLLDPTLTEIKKSA